MGNVTELEFKALKAIFKNSDGGDGRTLDALENDNCSWFNTSGLATYCDWSLNRAKGVIGSLITKGLIEDYGTGECQMPFFLSYGKGFETLRNLGITTVDDC
mgnify:CR=1 FL=1